MSTVAEPSRAIRAGPTGPSSTLDRQAVRGTPETHQELSRGNVNLTWPRGDGQGQSRHSRLSVRVAHPQRAVCLLGFVRSAWIPRTAPL